jgi:tetratricopeptide (TPR) repeat protein
MIVRRLQGMMDATGQIQSAQNIQLSDDGWHEYALETYALSIDHEQVRPNATFLWSDPLTSTEVVQVLEAADKVPEAAYEDIQSAIWAIVDAVDQEDLIDKGYTPNLETVRAIFEAANLPPENKRLFSQDQPNTAEEYLVRGEGYEQKEEYIQALADYSEAIDLQPDYIEALYKRGVIFYQLQNYDEAIADLTEVINLDDQHHNGYFHLGKLYASKPNPNFEQAIIYIDKAISLDPRFADAYYTRGQLHVANQNFAQAIEDFDQAISHNKEFTDAYYARGLIYSGVQDFEDFDKAITDFERVIELDTEFIDAYFALAEALVFKQDLAGAASSLSKIIDQVPDLAETYKVRGRIYQAQEAYNLAIKDFKKYLELNPSAANRQEIESLIESLQEIVLAQGPEAISLTEALKGESVEVEILGRDIPSGDSIRLTVTPLVENELVITVPSGIVLKSNVSTQQDMVIRQLRWLVLNDEEVQPVGVIHLTTAQSQTYILEAYGLNYNKAFSNSETTFELGELADPDVRNVLEAADRLLLGTDVQTIHAIQAAIWAVTDDVTWLDLVNKQYQPNLGVTQITFQEAGLDPHCKRLFGGIPCASVGTPSPVDSIPQGIGVSSNRVQSFYTPEGISFERNEGITGQSENGRVSIELIGPTDNLEKIMVSIFLQSDNQEEQNKNLGYMAGMLSLIVPTWEDSTNWLIDNIKLAYDNNNNTPSHEAEMVHENIKITLQIVKQLGLVKLTFERSGLPALPTAIPRPTPTATPSPTPTPSPWILVADSTRDFRAPSTQDGEWAYFWAEHRGNFDFLPAVDGGDGCFSSGHQNFDIDICKELMQNRSSGEMAVQWRALRSGTYLFEWDSNNLQFAQRDRRISSQGSGIEFSHSVVIENVVEITDFFYWVTAADTTYHIKIYKLQE